MTKHRLYYAGIGSRKTPEPVLELMTKVSSKLKKEGYILRSGGAKGADTVFSDGVSNEENEEIFTVSEELDLSKGNFINLIKLNGEPIYTSRQGIYSVSKYHPKPKTLKSEYIRLLMVRNYYQILGYRETIDYPNGQLRINIFHDKPVKFVICWTEDACKSNSTRSIYTGGTGQAISIADANNIPIYNLARKADYNLFQCYLHNDIEIMKLLNLN